MNIGILLVLFLVLCLIYFRLRYLGRMQRAPLRLHSHEPHKELHALRDILDMLTELTRQEIAFVADHAIPSMELHYLCNFHSGRHVLYSHKMNKGDRFEKVVVFPEQCAIEYENELPFCLSMHERGFESGYLQNLPRAERQVFIEFVRKIREECLA